ncbi:hypothetical protein BDA99DRAFT_541720 [Phascolomyces articulosus]|uniref:Uncharacterized protein n=1 Tax=Phascolomyces articulosus TaxID=60185 RepID=A0AAD5JR01_9FUNG|nr:hypothetical protein BDA99DRAFT_541720 [Phascolomyces articulosus]
MSLKICLTPRQLFRAQSNFYKNAFMVDQKMCWSRNINKKIFVWESLFFVASPLIASNAILAAPLHSLIALYKGYVFKFRAPPLASPPNGAKTETRVFTELHSYGIDDTQSGHRESVRAKMYAHKIEAYHM